MSACICGSQRKREFDHAYHRVSEDGVTEKAPGTMRMAECDECGIVRQADMTPQDYENYPPTKPAYRAKDYEHDKQLARERCRQYGISGNCSDKILDVGAGSGAFVDECRERGASAYGCEPSRYHYQTYDSFIYRDCFEDVHFPTDSFDRVTCHDVIEHVMDPLAFARELHRVTAQGGSCVIDLPRFFHPAGKHHWKIEHRWYFQPEQLKSLVESVGFRVTEIRNPIESKTLFTMVKPHEDRPTILLPPGIGDGYWVIVKLRSFLKREKLGMPDLYVACPKEKKYGGHKRSFAFLEMIPFVHATGNAVWTQRKGEVWKEAYGSVGRTIFRDVVGCDWFLSYNGHLRVGRPLEQIDRDLECEWVPPMFASLEQRDFRDSWSNRGGYIVCYFVFQGTYGYWTKEFPVAQVADAVKLMSKKTGCVPVFVGAAWDADDAQLGALIEAVPESVNLVGKTTLQQAFGLMKGARAVVGYPSGLTIMAGVLGVKTLVIWNDYYNRDFSWFALPPETRGTSYLTENTKGLRPDLVADKVANLIAWEPGSPPISSPSPLPAMPRRSATRVVVACVLKSGGEYDVDYVERLRNMIARNVTLPHRFVCLSDIDVSGICEHVRISGDLDRWWSKIEMFRPGAIDADRVLYFDLDSVILKNIDDAVRIDADFAALMPWNKVNQLKGMCASGMMSWNNAEHSFLYENFDRQFIRRFPRGDQHYISETLRSNGRSFCPIQSLIRGVYSYKRSCRTGLPKDARIICFHGSPRPREAAKLHHWIAENWI